MPHLKSELFYTGPCGSGTTLNVLRQSCAGHEFNFVDLVLSAWALANRKIKRGSRGVPRALEVEERHAESSDILGPMLITVNLCRLDKIKIPCGRCHKATNSKAVGDTQPTALLSSPTCRATPWTRHSRIYRTGGGFLPTSSATRKGSAPAQARSRLRSC